MRLWQQVEEVGGPLAMRMTFILLKTLPYALLVLIAIPVSFFYWVIDGKGKGPQCRLRAFEILVRDTGFEPVTPAV